MNKLSIIIILFIAMFGFVNVYSQEDQFGTPNVDQVISTWPMASQEAAKMMITKYGAPNEVTSSMLIWLNNGPWKKTIISSMEVNHAFPMPHKDVMEQVIDYKVPSEFADDLNEYDGSVIIERTKGELSARCDKEGANFLAINLANDIITGKRTVEEARTFYADQVKKMMAGELTEYTSGFVFTPKSGTADPDKPVMKNDMGK